MANSIRKIENDNEVDKLLNEKCTTAVRKGYVEVGKDKICLPMYYQKYEEQIRNFEVLDDDVYLFGIAKSGTTWCHQMLWLIVNNLDYEGAKQPSYLRCPMLEGPILYDVEILNKDFPEIIPDPKELLHKFNRPRCIKSHLHWSLLPEQIRSRSKMPKIICIFRNPKDTCVSYYHMARITEGYTGTFEEFCKLYLNGRVTYAPYWKHVQSFWEQRHRSNILMIKYEEMKADLPAIIKKVAKFLGKNFTDEQIEQLAQYLSFDSMKQDYKDNSKELFDSFTKKYNLAVTEGDFIRSGKTGDYQSIMTTDLIKQFDDWTKENIPGDFNI